MIRFGPAGFLTPDRVGIVYPAPGPKGFDPLHAEGTLGAVFLQFPWWVRRTDANREWLDDVAKTFRDSPLVLEVRHESWRPRDGFRDRALPHERYDYLSPARELEPWAERTKEIAARPEP